MERTKTSYDKISCRKAKGITLIALVITIVILIILATITINVAFGEGGLIERAQQAKELTEQAIRDEGEKINAVMSEYANIMGEETEIPEPNLNEVDPGPVEPEMPDTVEEAKTEGTVFTETKQIEDGKGNKITIPEGFKIAGGENGSGDTVQQGIVIEDAFSEDVNVRGSQYVWIPVGKFIKDDGTESNEIVLGRYTFADDENGTPTLQQAAYTEENPDNYKTPVVIKSCFSELVEYRVGVASSGSDGLNATAYNLEAWMNSVKNNGGYYIARYEASYASGSSTADYKCASKESKAYANSMSYNPGTLWNDITQLDASKVAINTYKDSSNGVKSDLMNSYAWDTAIVFIQECGYTNYANQVSKNKSLANTGTNNDEVCKINDLASNCCEWTTEYSSNTHSNSAYPCVLRGGRYGNSYYYSSIRISTYATNSSYNVSFRPSLYLVDLNAGE